jgi:hypothetical protein
MNDVKIVLLPDANNVALVSTLRLCLGKWRWSFQRLAEACRWHRDPEWLAGVTKLADEMGLIAPVQPKVKRPIKQPSESDEGPLVLPVMLAPQLPKPAKIIKLSDRKPKPWIKEGSDDEQH